MAGCTELESLVRESFPQRLVAGSWVMWAPVLWQCINHYCGCKHNNKKRCLGCHDRNLLQGQCHFLLAMWRSRHPDATLMGAN